MLRALFAAHPTVGHTQALRAIGKALLARGASVRFALPHLPRVPGFVKLPEPIRVATGLPSALARDGFEVVRAPASLESLYHAAKVARSRGYDELSHAVSMFTVDALPTARVLLSEAKARPFDLVVADFAYVGAWLAAEALGVPYAAVFHSGLPFRVEGAPPFGSGLPMGAPRALWREAEQRLEAIEDSARSRLNRARGALGLRPVPLGTFTRPYAGGLNVLTTFEALELPRPTLQDEAQGPILWAGPCLGDRTSEAPAFPWERLSPDARWVYISLGTVFNHQPEVYRALLAAVHRAGARAVVAAGASVEALSSVARPDDVVVRFAPQLELLSRVTAMIGHGGNNSTNEALRAGCPLLVVPFGAEQIVNGQRVELLGVGASVSPDHLSGESLDRALAVVLSEAPRARARDLARGLPEGDGAARVADALEALAPPARR